MGEFLRLRLLSIDDIATARRLTDNVAKAAGMTSPDQDKLTFMVFGMVRRTFASSSQGELTFATDTAPDGGLTLVVTVFDAQGDPYGGGGTPSSALFTFASDLGQLYPGKVRRLIGKHAHGTSASGAHYTSVAVEIGEESADDPTFHDLLSAACSLPLGARHSGASIALRERLGGRAPRDLRQRLGALRPSGGGRK